MANTENDSMRSRLHSGHLVASKENTSNKEDEQCGCTVACCSHESVRCACSSLQPFATAQCALVLFCLAQVFLQTVMAGLLSVCISTLERRFELQSTESGIIASSLDISSVCMLLIISFMGEDVHKPRWIGTGVLISVVGGLLFSAPHFIAPAYTYIEEEMYNLCGNFTEPDCTHSNLRDFRFVFIAAMALFGIGANPLYTHAVTYMDESVKKDKSSLYNGIYYAMAGLGPAFGYLCGGAVLEIYTNLSVKREDLTIDSSSYLWIGAWWLGFLVCSLMLLVSAIPLLMLPRHLPGTEKHRIDRNLEVQKSMMKKQKQAEEETAHKSGFLESLSSLILLLKNRPYVFITLGSTVNSAFIYGFNTFGAKYLESVFGLTSFHAAVIYGVAAIFSSIGGHVLGGVVVSRFSMSVHGIQKLMIWIGLFSALCSLGFFVHCPEIDFAGGTQPYFNESLNYSPLSSCNMGCGCSTDHYEPICGGDGVTYFSPCYAGCTKQINESVYTECLCIPNIYNTTAESIAIMKPCEKNSCNAIIPFVFIVFLCFFSSILTSPMSVQVTLRCVPFQNRTMAIALQRAIKLALGIMPGRILTGAVLDLACVTWSTECGERGSCRSYLRWELARNTALLLFAQTAACVVFYALSFCTYKASSQESDINEGKSEADSEKEALTGAEANGIAIGLNVSITKLNVDEFNNRETTV